MNASELWLIRHAESDEHRAPSMSRLTHDPSLSVAGTDQARALARRLRPLPAPSAVQTSPLRRAVATATLALPDVRPVRVSELSEFDRGDLRNAEVGSDEYRSAWRGGQWDQWPGGESRTEFRARCVRYVATWKRRATPGSVTIAFTHAGVVQECVASVLGGMDAHLVRVAPTSITRLILRGPHLLVVGLNDVWHLEDPLAHRIGRRGGQDSVERHPVAAHPPHDEGED